MLNSNENKKQKKIAKTSIKTKILKELAKDFDWNAAAKRAGISKGQLATLKKDESFMNKGQAIIERAMENIGAKEIEQAIQKFNATQKTLAEMLADGETAVASALVKTHELEYRMHGLFEKDNRQKQAPITINISLDEPQEILDVTTIDGDSKVLS